MGCMTSPKEKASFIKWHVAETNTEYTKTRDPEAISLTLATIAITLIKSALQYQNQKRIVDLARTILIF